MTNKLALYRNNNTDTLVLVADTLEAVCDHLLTFHKELYTSLRVTKINTQTTHYTYGDPTSAVDNFAIEYTLTLHPMYVGMMSPQYYVTQIKSI